MGQGLPILCHCRRRSSGQREVESRGHRRCLRPVPERGRPGDLGVEAGERVVVEPGRDDDAPCWLGCTTTVSTLLPAVPVVLVGGEHHQRGDPTSSPDRPGSCVIQRLEPGVGRREGGSRARRDTGRGRPCRRWAGEPAVMSAAEGADRDGRASRHRRTLVDEVRPRVVLDGVPPRWRSGRSGRGMRVGIHSGGPDRPRCARPKTDAPVTGRCRRAPRRGDAVGAARRRSRGSWAATGAGCAK